MKQDGRNPGEHEVSSITCTSLITHTNFTWKLTFCSVLQMAVLKYLRAFDADRFSIIKSNDGFIYKNHICLEMELLDISLLEFLKDKPAGCLSVKEIRPVLQQVCAALVKSPTWTNRVGNSSDVSPYKGPHTGNFREQPPRT